MSVIDQSAVNNSDETGTPLDASRGDIAESIRLIAQPDTMVDAAVDVLATRHQVSTQDAVDLLNQAAGDHDRPVGEVARDVVLIGLPSLPTQIELRPSSSEELTTVPLSGSPTDSTTPQPPAGVAAVQRALSAAVSSALLERLVALASWPDVLKAVSDLAAFVVPGCEAAAVTVLREGAPATVVSTDHRARYVDETQYSNGQGPYLRAAHTHQMVRIDDINSLPAGQAWAQAALEVGFVSVLTLTLLTGTQTAATLSMYASRGDGWSDESLAAAQAVADQAGSAIAFAERLMTDS
jgi:GAF domain-containing protein